MEEKKNTEVKPEDSTAQIPSAASCYLLPCPFCGWEPDGPADWVDDMATIVCGNAACSCEIQLPNPEVMAVTAWNSRISGWISVKDRCPAIGQRVILFGNGVVQNEIFEFSAADVSDYAPLEYFWNREDLEEGILVEDGQFWMSLPEGPEAR